MKAHNILMATMALIALALIVFAPSVGLGRGFGLLLLLCPLMMIGMMFMMGKGGGHKH